MNLIERICVFEGDIIQCDAEAIVNAANTSLLGGGGVDGAIHRAAGPMLLEECRTLNGCKVGEAKLTKGYQLKAKFVIHTVGPFWNGGGGNEAKLLAECYRNSLLLAQEREIRSVAFPCISTGAYRYPLEEATNIAVSEVFDFLENNSDLAKVVFVCFSSPDAEVYRRILNLKHKVCV